MKRENETIMLGEFNPEERLKLARGESIAVDVTVQNVEILRKRVTAAESLLAEWESTFGEPSKSGNLGQVTRDFLASQQGEQVKHPEQAEGAQGDEEWMPDGVVESLMRADSVDVVGMAIAALAQPSPKSGYYSDQEWINAGCPTEQPFPAPELDDELQLLRSVLNGYQPSIARNDGLRAIVEVERILGALRVAHQITLDELHAMEVHVAQAGRDIDAAQARVADVTAELVAAKEAVAKHEEDK